MGHVIILGALLGKQNFAGFLVSYTITRKEFLHRVFEGAGVPRGGILDEILQNRGSVDIVSQEFLQVTDNPVIPEMIVSSEICRNF